MCSTSIDSIHTCTDVFRHLAAAASGTRTATAWSTRTCPSAIGSTLEDIPGQEISAANSPNGWRAIRAEHPTGFPTNSSLRLQAGGFKNGKPDVQVTGSQKSGEACPPRSPPLKGALTEIKKTFAKPLLYAFEKSPHHSLTATHVFGNFDIRGALQSSFEHFTLLRVQRPH